MPKNDDSDVLTNLAIEIQLNDPRRVSFASAAKESTVQVKQKTYYVREDLARIVAMIAVREEKRESNLVDEALLQFIQTKLTPEEIKVFSSKKENADERASRSSRDAGDVRRVGEREERAHGKRGSAPGTKKRAG